MSSPITVLTAPYNVLNPNVISIDSRLSSQGLKEANQTPNYDVVLDPIKPKECIECFENSTTNTKPEQEQSASNSNLVDNDLVDTALSNYLTGKTDYYDNKTEMVDNTIPYDPLKSLVKNYLQDNISMYDNRGKYFDQFLFNAKFDEYIDEKNKERLLKEKVKLYDLNKVENIEIQPYDLPLNKILINTKNTWFNMYDDISNGKNPTKNLNFKSYFYIGVTLIVITILYVFLSYIFN